MYKKSGRPSKGCNALRCDIHGRVTESEMHTIETALKKLEVHLRRKVKLSEFIREACLEYCKQTPRKPEIKITDNELKNLHELIEGGASRNEVFSWVYYKITGDTLR